MQETSLIEQWLVIYRRKWQVLTVIVACVATAVTMSNQMTPVYEASTIFYPPLASLEATYFSPDSATKSARGTLIPAPNEDALAPYIGILKSRLIAERVAAQFPAVESHKQLQSNMDFEVTNEYLLRVYSRAHEPELAADVANAYFRHLNLILNEVSLAQFDSDETLLRNQHDELTTAIEQEKQKLLAFELEHNLANLAEAISSRYTTHTSLIAGLDTLQIRRKAIDSKVQANRRELEREKDGLLSPNAAFPESLRQNLVSALIERDTNQAQIEAATNALVKSREELTRLPLIKAEWSQLRQEIALKELEAEQLRKNLREMELQRVRAIEHLVLLDSATPPSLPAFPSLPINVVVSLIVGTLGGLFYALLVDYASRETSKSARKLALEIRHRTGGNL